MTEHPIPNSIDFSELSTSDQLSILTERAIEAGQVTMAEIWKIEEEEPWKPEAWYYEPDLVALKGWQQGIKIRGGR